MVDPTAGIGSAAGPVVDDARVAPTRPPQHLGLVARWMLGGPFWVRCATAAVAFAVIAGALGEGESVDRIVARVVVGAGLGVAYALLFAWLRRLGQRPRGPERISNWRIGQMLRQDAAPSAPLERAALHRTLVRARALRWRIANGVAIAVWAFISLGSIAFFAVDRDWGWFAVSVVFYPLLSLHLAHRARREVRRREGLRQQLHGQGPPDEHSSQT